MKCFTYILYSRNIDKYYVGYTCDSLENRLAKHNSKNKGYTNQTNDWSIVYFESFDSKVLAMNREKKIKSWKSRVAIEKLINAAVS